MIELVIEPTGRAGLFSARVGDDTIVRSSRQPFLDGARVLLASGHDPAASYNMRHANSATPSFVTTTIGCAAGLSVVDAATGTRFRKFVSCDDTDEPIEEAAE